MTQRPDNGSFFGQDAESRKTKTTQRVLEKMRAWGYSLRGSMAAEGRLAYVRIMRDEEARYVTSMESLRRASALGIDGGAAWAEIEQSAQAHYNRTIADRMAIPWRPPY